MRLNLHVIPDRGTLTKATLQLRVQVCCVLAFSALSGCMGQPEQATPVALLSPLATAQLADTPSPRPEQATPTALTTDPTGEAGSQNQPVLFAGNWIGGYTLAGGTAREQMLSITFSESAGQLGGQVVTALDGTSDQLGSVRLQGDLLHFEWGPGSTGAGAAVFEGRLSGHTIEGTVQQGGNTAPFALARSEQPAQGEYGQFAGTYRFSSGRAIGFYKVDDPQSQVFASSLVYADLQSGELGAAFPISGTTFEVGSALGLAYPFRAEVSFVPDASGNIRSVKWLQKGQAEAVANRVDVKTEEVKYQSEGNITLAGQLTSPSTPGKHPAVVIVHGAGKVTRQNWLTDLLGGLFALDGIATLSYDKRGVGDSGGDYNGGVASQQNVELLGQDALAGVAYLKSRSDIDATRIGMQGQSQAGWIIPFAAAQSGDVAFMVLWSGPGVPQGIADLYDSIAESKDRAEVTSELLNTAPSGFDPAPYLEKTAAPGFWAFGDRDMTVPVPESIANLEKIKAAGQKDFTWQTFPGADHYLLTVASPTGDDLRLSHGYPSGMISAMMQWLRQHVNGR